MSGSSPAGLSVIRNRHLVTHISPTEAEIVDEVTLFNASAQELTDILITRPIFMPGLRVLDYDGSDLAYLPNESAKELIASQLGADPKYKKLLELMDRDELFVLWIKLPKDRPIKPNDARVVKLSYIYEKNPETLLLSIFSIPRFKKTKVTPPDEKYSTFYVIRPPSNFRIRKKILKKAKIVENREEELTPELGFYDDSTDRLIALRVPPSDATVRFEMNYDIVLESSEIWFCRLLCTLVLALTLLVGLAAFPASPQMQLLGKDVMTLICRNYEALSGLAILLDAAAIALSTNPLTHRTKVVPMASLIVVVSLFVFKSVLG